MKKTFLVILAIILSISIACQAELRVPSQYPRIQAAINAAVNGNVVIVQPGRYYESINFSGKSITVRSTQPGNPNIVASTIIDANGLGSVVTFTNNEGPAAVLTGFTITGGTGTVNSSFGSDIYWGAGIYCYSTSPTIRGNVIVGNNSPMGDGTQYGYGGGISCLESNAIVTGNIIRENETYAGGGIMVYFGSPLITSNLIYNNSAGIGGGVCLLYGGLLSNNTVTGNSSSYGAGGNIYAESDANVGQCQIVSNIIINSTNGYGIYLASSGNETIAYNDFFNNNFGNYYGLPDQTGINGNISKDPLFVNPQTNDYHLQYGSPCIDKGSPIFVGSMDSIDIDGNNRVMYGRVDMGADEFIGRPIADGADLSMSIIPVLVNLDGSHSYDLMGNQLTYRWRQIGGPSIELSNPNTVSPSFKPVELGIYSFELIVNNGLLDSYPDKVVIVIGNNHAPVAEAGLPRYVAETIVLDGRNSYDPDGSKDLVYHWQQVSGPNVIISNGNTATPTISGFIQSGIVQKCEFELVVSDGDLNSVPDTVEVVIVPNFGNNAIYQENPPFDPNKPTIYAFGGGNCFTGGGMSFGGIWEERANWLTVTSYDTSYSKYGDMLMVYLSSVAPDYHQPIQTIGFSTGNNPAMTVAKYINLTYKDWHYAVNRVTLLDAVCGNFSLTDVTEYLDNPVDSEQCWIDNYRAETMGAPVLQRAMNVSFPATATHSTPVSWYMVTPGSSVWTTDIYNHGITAGYYTNCI